MRSRQVELDQLLSRKAKFKEEIEVYLELVRKEETALVAAQRMVEYHAAYISFLHSRPTAPSSAHNNNSDSGTGGSLSRCVTSDLDAELSDSTQEFKLMLENETRRFSNAKALLHEIHTRLEEPKVHLVVREKRLKQLEWLVDTLHAEIRDLAGLTRPLLRVPEEMWVLIFNRVLGSDLEEYQDGGKGLFFFPSTLQLSQVCHRWRQITYNNPSLWTEIGFVLDRYWDPCRVESFKFLLELAGDQSVFLIADMSGADTGRPPNPQGVDIASIQGIRRTNFTLGVLDPPITLDLRDLCFQMGFSSFEEIIIFGMPHDRRSFIVTGMPNTLKVSLLDFFFSSNISTLENTHYLWLRTDLTTVEIDASPYLFRSLRDLSLCGDSLDLPSQSSSEVLLPELVSLRLSPLQQHVLKRVKAPRLATLILEPPDHGNECVHGDWSSPLLRMSRLCSVVIFEDWRAPLSDTLVPPYFLAATVCLEIIKGSQNLTIVKFRHSFVDGKQLTAGLGTLMSPKIGIGELKLIIDYCTGITRMDCDILSGIVDCLEIYV
ncbi:hypothetical protein FRB91_011051 [Serendipita sp. 411]|nr:hypothetical protein FRC18_004039 [Serendipita sp. 400]KAG8848181.1 hypothetical protein FRB91_011051 [Serendipita sp. 411]